MDLDKNGQDKRLSSIQEKLLKDNGLLSKEFINHYKNPVSLIQHPNSQDLSDNFRRNAKKIRICELETEIDKQFHWYVFFLWFILVIFIFH